MQQTKLAGCGWRIQMTTNTVLHTFARAVVAAKDGRDIVRRNQKERLGYQRKLGANFGLDSGVYGRNDPLLRSWPQQLPVAHPSKRQKLPLPLGKAFTSKRKMEAFTVELR